MSLWTRGPVVGCLCLVLLMVGKHLLLFHKDVDDLSHPLLTGVLGDGHEARCDQERLLDV